MTVDEVMQEFRKLPREEQREVFEVLCSELAADPSPDQLAEFERRAERLRQNPSAGIPWEQVRAELPARLESRRTCPAE